MTSESKARREPDYTSTFKGGTVWSVWRCQNEVKRTPDHAAHLAGWILHCPGAHLMWSYWHVGLVHLRDLPGVKPAKKTYKEAEHELFVFAINPEAGDVDPDAGPWPHLEPFDHVVQFHGVNDVQAVHVIERMLSLVMSGEISPDQDYRQIWRATIPAIARKVAEERWAPS